MPIEDHHLLREDFDEFEVGEYVGYELNDDLSSGDITVGDISSGETIEAPVPVSPGGGGGGGAEQATFVYAVILKRVAEEGVTSHSPLGAKMRRTSQSARRGSLSVATDGTASTVRQRLTQMYVISVGEEREPITVHATDLYKFHRVERIAAPGGVPFASSPSAVSNSARRDSMSRQRLGSMSRQRKSSDSATKSVKDGLRSANDSISDAASKHSVNGSRNGSEGSAFGGHDQNQAADNRLSVYKNQNGGRDVSVGREQDGVADDAGETAREDGRNEAAVRNEISDTLEEAWKLPIAQRKKVH